MLGRLAREVDLDQQFRCGPGVGRSGVDCIEKPQAVYGVNGAEAGYRLPNLVRLQGPDQMPSDL